MGCYYGISPVGMVFFSLVCSEILSEKPKRTKQNKGKKRLRIFMFSFESVEKDL